MLLLLLLFVCGGGSGDFDLLVDAVGFVVVVIPFGVLGVVSALAVDIVVFVHVLSIVFFLMLSLLFFCPDLFSFPPVPWAQSSSLRSIQDRNQNCCEG